MNDFWLTLASPCFSSVMTVNKSYFKCWVSGRAAAQRPLFCLLKYQWARYRIPNCSCSHGMCLFLWLPCERVNATIVDLKRAVKKSSLLSCPCFRRFNKTDLQHVFRSTLIQSFKAGGQVSKSTAFKMIKSLTSSQSATISGTPGVIKYLNVNVKYAQGFFFKAWQANLSLWPTASWQLFGGMES